MNFIIKLFKLKNLASDKIYNFIFVMINYLIKYIYIILFKKIYNAK